MLPRIILAVFLSIVLSTAANSATIKGRVVESLTGEPIEGATVCINDTLNGDISDEVGSFEINDVEPGIYSLKILSLSFWSVYLTCHINSLDSIYNIGTIPTIFYLWENLCPDMTPHSETDEKWKFVEYAKDDGTNYPLYIGEIHIDESNSIIFHVDTLYNIGTYIPKAITEYSLDANPADVEHKISKLYQYIHDNIQYGFTIDRNNCVNYINTLDTNFKTVEGLKIGDTYNEVTKYAIPNSLMQWGWGYYVPLPSGWNAAFCIGDSCSDHPPDSNSTISWFFKK